MQRLWQDKRNWVVMGESGVGKTEVALYLAKQRRKEGNVCFIDMDQTKGMFRARDYKRALHKEGIDLVAGAHFMDMPVVPHGVERLLAEQETYHILDVGGNEIGAVALGQFANRINDEDGAVFYIINPFRSFSQTAQQLQTMMTSITGAGRIKAFHIICNAYLGIDTTEKDILDGFALLTRNLSLLGLHIEGLVLPYWVEAAAFDRIPLAKWIITPQIQYP